MIDNEYYFENYGEWFIPKFEYHLDSYMQGLSSWMTDPFLNKSSPIGWIADSLWINYQKAKEYNPPHNHSGDLSFVIYLQVPDELKKEYESTKGVHNNVGPGVINFDFGIELPFSISRFFRMPEVRDIFIFPAWLVHYVHAFKSDVERISVSGNIKFLYKAEDDVCIK
tara:strand:- start:1267 stop:1770 length:504 start_codon:yes stop_codon:yes gene_type:complete